jgi:hypothetical protein
MERELKDKVVKVYKDVETKRFYEGDGRIERVLKQLSYKLYLVDACFEDSYFTTVIDMNDILY